MDVSRGDVLSATPLHTARHLEANVVWMDERPLDPSRVYLLKHAARTVSAELDMLEPERHRAGDRDRRSAARVRRLRTESDHRQLHRHRPGHQRGGAGMIVRALDEESGSTAGAAAAERIARAARSAPSEEAAIDAVRRLLEDMLT